MSTTCSSSEVEEVLEHPNSVLGVYDLVIADVEQSAILCSIEQNGAFALPRVKPCGRWREFYWEVDEEEVVKHISNQFAFKCRILRPLWYCDNDDEDDRDCVQQAVLEVEVLDWSFTVPKGYKWMKKNSPSWDWLAFCNGITWTQLCHMVFEQASSDKTPWRVRGWVAEVVKWVELVLEDEGIRIKTGPQAVSHTDESFVIKFDVFDVESEHNLKEVYVKATTPHVREAAITQALSSITQSIVPRVIAVNSERNVFVQEGMSKVQNKEFCPELLVRTLAKLHASSQSYVEEVVAAGAEVLDAKWLRGNVDSLLIDPVLDELDEGDNHFSREELSASIGHVKNVCTELEQSGIASTVVHGDLHMDNIGCGKEKDVYCMIDWGTCVISHPFQDFHQAYEHIPEMKSSMRAAMEMIYLKYWDSHLSIEDLRRCIKLSGVLYWGIDLYRCLKSVDLVSKNEREERVAEVGKSIRCLLRALDEACGEYSDVSSESVLQCGPEDVIW